MLARFENVFDRLPEQLGDAERQRQARIVFARFDGVDGLARYIEMLGQIALRPAARFAQFADVIVHGFAARRRSQ